MAKTVATSVDIMVSVDGLAPFSKALKSVDNSFAAQMALANFKLATQLVNFAQQRAGEQSLRTDRKAAESLRATKTASYAAILGGGARYPYFFGAEFGAKRYRQFESWRGNQWGGWDGGPGYFLNPAVRDDAGPLLDEYMATLNRLTSEAFPEL